MCKTIIFIYLVTSTLVSFIGLKSIGSIANLEVAQTKRTDILKCSKDYQESCVGEVKGQFVEICNQWKECSNENSEIPLDMWTVFTGTYLTIQRYGLVNFLIIGTISGIFSLIMLSFS